VEDRERAVGDVSSRMTMQGQGTARDSLRVALIIVVAARVLLTGSFSLWLLFSAMFFSRNWAG